jgi:thiol-disulfide isomerase/thioredoxin
MNKILLLLAASAFALSCNRQAENEYKISGTVDPSLNGKKIILEKPGGYLFFTPVDTAVVEDGKFEFEGTITGVEQRFLSIADPMKKLDIILEPGSIKIEVNKDTIVRSIRKGTYNNEKLQEYYDSRYSVIKKAMAWQRQKAEAVQKGDTAALKKSNIDFETLDKEMQQTAFDFVTKYPDSYVSVTLIKKMATSGKVPLFEVKKYYNGLTAKMKKTPEGMEIADAIAKAESPAAVGKTAPEFTAPTPDGKMVSLKQSMGKVTIIDFWASWCGPCRKENPNVVALYNDFHSKGLNIISVSLDRPGQADKWKQAIAADKLNWTHVSNLLEWEDPIAKQYAVTGIPATFILDEKGTVVARDLRGAELRSVVSQMLIK